jgi:hypothetical protein
MAPSGLKRTGGMRNVYLAARLVSHSQSLLRTTRNRKWRPEQLSAAHTHAH